MWAFHRLDAVCWIGAAVNNIRQLFNVASKFSEMYPLGRSSCINPSGSCDQWQGIARESAFLWNVIISPLRRLRCCLIKLGSHFKLGRQRLSFLWAAMCTNFQLIHFRLIHLRSVESGRRLLTFRLNWRNWNGQAALRGRPINFRHSNLVNPKILFQNSFEISSRFEWEERIRSKILFFFFYCSIFFPLPLGNWNQQRDTQQQQQ